MTPIVRFLTGGWTFFWRQPALLRSTALLVFLPLLVMGYLEMPFESDRPEQAAVQVVLHLAMILALTWGVACTLTVGKRLLQAKAGRLRTSFKAVQGQARGLVIPLILTDILRGCITALWGIPLAALFIVAGTIADSHNIPLAAFVQLYPWIIVLAILFLIPPALYALQTILAPLIVAYEKIAFRPALARSRMLTHGRLPRTLLTVLLLGLLWVPGLVAGELLLRFADENVSLIAMPIVTAFFDTFAVVLWFLALTQYYQVMVRQAHHDNGPL